MAMAMLGKVAMRSLRRSVLAAAATAPRSWARDVPRRLSSSGGNLLAEEGKAAETIYIKKKEEERAQNIAVLKGDENSEASVVPCTATPSIPTSASLTSNPKGRLSMLDIMDHIENNDFDAVELKYAMRTILQKCGTNKDLIEMELSMEKKVLKDADKLQKDYVSEVSKEAILEAELQKARTEKKTLDDKCAEFERMNSSKGFWKNVKSAAVNAAIPLAIGAIVEKIHIFGQWI